MNRFEKQTVLHAKRDTIGYRKTQQSCLSTGSHVSLLFSKQQALEREKIL